MKHAALRELLYSNNLEVHMAESDSTWPKQKPKTDLNTNRMKQ